MYSLLQRELAKIWLFLFLTVTLWSVYTMLFCESMKGGPLTKLGDAMHSMPSFRHIATSIFYTWARVSRQSLKQNDPFFQSHRRVYDLANVLWMMWSCGLERNDLPSEQPLTPSTPAVPNCCCSKGSAPYWSNPLLLIFDIRALWRSDLSARAPKCQKLKMVRLVWQSVKP